MQIDDYQQAAELTRRIKASLPMQVRPTKHGLKAFQDEKVEITIQSWFNVKDAFYSGDEGGILLALEPYTDESEKVVVSSITHLVINPEHSLASEINAYQRRRISKLALQHRRGFAKELLADQQQVRQKKSKGFG